MASSPISRRHMLTGLGAVGGAAALGMPAAAAASAVPGSGSRPSDVSPVLPSPISSPPQSGVHYEFRSYDDFEPGAFDDGKNFGGSGAYTPNSTSAALTTTFDLPPGATLYDVEWYVLNTSGGTANCQLRIWSSGSGLDFAGGVDTAITTNSKAVVAARSVVPTSSNGPFPHGTRAVATCLTTSDLKVQVNGVRLGYKSAPAATVLLPSPVRVVDSRTSGGALGNSDTRSISLASYVPVGALGALFNLTVVGTVGAGYLRTYATGTPIPTASSINWYASNLVLANQVTCALTTARSVSLFCRSQTDFLIDLLGYLV